MSALERIHAHAIVDRRVRVLVKHLIPLVPARARLLDVGCGDGRIARALVGARPDLTVHGVDVLVRGDALIEVEAFDGERLPAGDGAFDVVLFVDVLHHTDHARALLREARRVAARWVIVKDHTTSGLLAVPTLRFMDRVGNARHGVALPYHYWSEPHWRRVLAEERLEVDRWESRLGLYPFPSSLLFDRRLHFIARLGARAA